MPGDGRFNAPMAVTATMLVAGPNISGAGYYPTMNIGMLWAYTDCLAKKAPIIKGPADQFLVGADPVTGRNQQVDLSWEQLCLSTAYEIMIAKDPAFTLKINPQQNNANLIGSVVGPIVIYMDKGNMTSPAMWIAPGALPEAGAIYYWMVRSHQSATGQLAWSPWSRLRAASPLKLASSSTPLTTAYNCLPEQRLHRHARLSPHPSPGAPGKRPPSTSSTLPRTLSSSSS